MSRERGEGRPKEGKGHTACYCTVIPLFVRHRRKYTERRMGREMVKSQGSRTRGGEPRELLGDEEM